MTRLRGYVTTVLALLGALPLLLLLDDEPRVWAFRAYVAVVALLASRSIVRWTDAAGAMSAGSTDDADPFHRPAFVARVAHLALARLPFRRNRTPLAGGAVLVHSAMSTAGGVHHRLRPVLQEIAEERLRSHTGVGLGIGDRGRDVVGPHGWPLVDPDRPAPPDRLAPGLAPADIALALDDLENL